METITIINCGNVYLVKAFSVFRGKVTVKRSDIVATVSDLPSDVVPVVVDRIV